jgi:hypothetical protein
MTLSFFGSSKKKIEEVPIQDLVFDFRLKLPSQLNAILIDSDCKRFIKARKTLNQSVDMAVEWEKWYHTSLFETDISPSNILSKIPEDPKEYIYAQYFPHSHLGEDKEGYPICKCIPS